MFQTFHREIWNIFLEIVKKLKFCALRCTWERYHVTNVLHTCHEQDKTLEAKTKACVRA